MENIKKALEDPLKILNMWIDDIKYFKKTLYITLDSDEIINIDRVVEATKVINKGCHTYSILFYSLILIVMILLPFTDFGQINHYVSINPTIARSIDPTFLTVIFSPNVK